MTNEALQILKQKISKYAADTNGQFAGERLLVGRGRAQVCEASVDYPMYRLSFLYHKGARRGPKSVLSCMFHIKGSERSMGYLIYDLLNIIDENDFSCYTYPFIPDAPSLALCCDELCDKLYKKLDKINALFDDPESVKTLRDTKMQDINNYFDKDIIKSTESVDAEVRDNYLRHVYDLFYAHLMSFFVSRAYAFYLDGDKKSALSHAHSMRAPSLYQRRFLNHLNDDTPAQTTALNFLRDGIFAQSKSALALPTILTMLGVALVLCPVFYGLHFLFIKLFASGAIYNTATEPENVMFCILPAVIMSGAVTACIKNHIIKFTGKNTRAKLERFSKILFVPQKKETLFYSVFTAVIVSLILSMVIANTGVKFFDKTMKINASPTQLRAVEYSYAAIEEVSEQEVSQGAIITTIKFDDGKMFSLVGVGDYNSVRTKIYPILEQKNIEIKKEDSIK